MNMWRKIFGTTALALMLCLTGLVMSGEAQAQRFVDNGNGTVTDTQTGLMWTKDANPMGPMDWYNAMVRCGSFSISGIGGWRLPSKNELLALSDAMQGGHPFTGFGQLPYYYWSSTTDANDADSAWSVDMSYGDNWTANKTDTLYVWPVRSGQ
ncbi:MAG: DUF1566 domain-containing protein [Desulfonatronovibrio sp.]|nr:DUF1566 domain-containing protein [Desulfovibrionales bacterium]